MPKWAETSLVRPADADIRPYNRNHLDGKPRPDAAARIGRKKRAAIAAAQYKKEESMETNVCLGRNHNRAMC